MVSPHSIQAKEELRRALHGLDPEIVAISADDFGSTLVHMNIDVRDQRPAVVASNFPGPVARARPQYAAEVKREADKQVQGVIGDEITQLLDRVLSEGVERGVSDIHFDPEATGLRIRYRVHGMLVDRKEMIPPSYAGPLAARVKVLAELDITERRLPQDGRIAATFGSREMNLRVSTMPSARGEAIVIRVLDPGDVLRPLEHIFQDPRALDLVQRALGASHGAIMLAGATGSGKSSTIYSMLNTRKIARPDNNIATIEDPIEFLVPGLRQSGLNPKAGLDYPAALRALMRQDPDVIMVGELRDESTARMVVEAALTGHLVLSTMHGSSIAAVFQRLEHFDCDAMRVGQSMNAIIVQRLARRLCAACTREEEVAPQLVDALLLRKLLVKGASPKLPRALGCEACNRSGYKGRVAAHEILFMGDDVRLSLEGGVSQTEVLARAEKAGHFLSFASSARLLMGKRAITPADALQLTS
jgi:type II secretory ATPase GspE/PulE/Tfp pilus assembly ATPase PilB-like protein